MRKLISAVLGALALMALTGSPVLAQSSLNPPANLSYVGGKFYSRRYIYPPVRINSGGGAAGTSYTINLSSGQVRLADGRTISPFSAGGFNILGQPGTFPAIPITVGAGAVKETVTPTAVSGCYNQAPQSTCAITASFTYAHGTGEVVATGSAGIQEAINDAAFFGGGVVVVDGSSAFDAGGTNAITAAIIAATVVPNVSIEDDRGDVPRYWNPTPVAAALAVPTTLTSQAACDATHQFCSDANVAGSASWGGAVYGCVAYVDIMGNEGPCSLASTVFTSVASKAIDIASPAASAGAVGWVAYLSLSGGTYAQAYAVPITAASCTLTTLETVIPACAIANTTYAQSTSTFGVNSLFTGGLQFTGYPLNTSQHFTKLASVAMTAASLTPVSNSSSSYLYAPSNRIGGCSAISSANVVNYAAAPSTATAIPNAIATWTIPAQCFNYIGAEFRVSGKWTYTDGGDTSTEVRVGWDANLSDATTIPTTLCSMLDTATGTGAAYNGTYTCTIKVATTGATGTALVNGYATQSLAAGATTLVRNGADVAVAPSAATVNWTVPARIVVYFIGTGATNNPGAQGLAASLEVIN